MNFAFTRVLPDTMDKTNGASKVFSDTVGFSGQMA